jgi:transposase
MSNKFGKRYTPQFKAEAVRLLLTSGLPASRVAADLGVSDVALGEWKKQALANGDQPEKARPNGIRIQYAVLEQENLRLRQELAVARQQRDILKKSLGIFCADPQPKGMP